MKRERERERNLKQFQIKTNNEVIIGRVFKIKKERYLKCISLLKVSRTMPKH